VTDAVLDNALDPLSPGLSGPWGSGKTTVLELVEADLTERSTSESKVVVVRTDPRRYDPIALCSWVSERPEVCGPCRHPRLSLPAGQFAASKSATSFCRPDMGRFIAALRFGRARTSLLSALLRARNNFR
jgi:hypothetical protein